MRQALREGNEALFIEAIIELGLKPGSSEYEESLKVGASGWRSTRFGGRKMERKRSASSARGKQAAGNARPIPDGRIDFSTVPESTGAELKRARRVGRPKSAHAKQLIAIRIVPRLLARPRRLARENHPPAGKHRDS
jgi:hypothetical protein